MSKQAPQNMLIGKKISFNETLPGKDADSISDKISVKDSTIYQFHNWEYLVKKQKFRNGEDEFLMWLDELSGQGWELIKSQPVNLGFYIFKKSSK